MNQDVLKAKKAQVEEIVDVVKKSQSFIVAEYRGLTVADTMTFKRALAKSNAKCSVYKNSLVSRAMENLGVQGLDAVLSGPNTFIYAPDVTTGAKEAIKFAKTHPNFLVKGGVVEGKFYSADEVKTLAKLPSREGLLSMLCSVLQAPVVNFACAIKAVADKQ